MAVLIGFVVLLGLIIGLRLNAFIALFITAITVGFASGMEGVKVMQSVHNGIGNTLGTLIPILGFGIMLGKLLTESGAAQRLSETLLSIFGAKRAKYALSLTGFVVGLAMFYNAGFVVLLPLVFAMATETGLPLIYLALSIAAPLSVTHGYLPPHPAPTAIAALFKANVGLTLLYGIVISIPVIIAAGWVFPEFFKKMKTSNATSLFNIPKKPTNEMPSFGISLMTAIFPVVLMGISTISSLMTPPSVAPTFLQKMLSFMGDPSISMLIAVLVAILTLGIMQGRDMKTIGKYAEESVGMIAMIILIIAGGGAFKQVLMDSGIGNQISDTFKTLSISPLVLGWLIAALVRVTIGSATVAGLMAGGIVAPMVAQSGANAELMVLSIGAGSLMFSHVNDTGFWMFKEYFGLSIRDTLLSWSLMETIVSILGLVGVLILDVFV
jgi:Gnt-I system high-affinity gluconate transporter